jgi:archaellum biogenesis ATPase FlaH
MTLRDAALRYARDGYRVVPLHDAPQGVCSCVAASSCQSPAKHPRIAGGYHSASSDPTIVEAWWTKWPTANIGLLTGEIVVIDVDDAAGIDVVRRLLGDAFEESDFDTVTATTNRGYHFYFDAGGLNLRTIRRWRGAPVDLLACGALVVAPYSLHAEGSEYAFEHGRGLIERRPRRISEALVKAFDVRANVSRGSFAGEKGRDARPLSLPRIQDAARALTETCPPPTFLIEHLIPMASLGLWTGDTGAGKSSLAIAAALSVATGETFGERFASSGPANVLYINGEMGASDFRRALRAYICDQSRENLQPGRFSFVGLDILSSGCSRNGGGAMVEALAAYIGETDARLVVLDSFRALFGTDENSAVDVRSVLSGVKALAEQHKCAVIVLHHVRKMGPVSNSPRERASGSRDLIAAVDVHLALRCAAGSFADGLVLDKTRTPWDNVRAQTEWPIRAQFVDTHPAEARIRFDAPTRRSNTQALDDAVSDIIATLRSEGSLSRKRLRAENGTRRRALEALLDDGRILDVGRDGRQHLYGVKPVGN